MPDAKTKRLHLRLSEKEHSMFISLAKDLKLSVSESIREAMLYLKKKTDKASDK